MKTRTYSPPYRPSQLKAFSLLIGGILLYAPPLFCQSQNLPLNHWAYQYIERLETKGAFINRSFASRPYPRKAFADMLIQIDQNLKAKPDLLSAVERQLFEQLKGEFHEELQEMATPISIRKDEYERHGYSWKSEDLVVHLDGLFAQQNKFETGRDVEPGIPKSSSSYGYAFRANIKKSLAIFSHGQSFILSDIDSLANTSFNPSMGLPITKKGLVDVAIADVASGYLVFKPPWFHLELGRDLVEWGPGFRGSLILSRSSNFYDLIKLSFPHEKLKVEYIHGFLNADHSKYVAGHRLEIRPTNFLQLAVSETVLYADRSVEPLYLNPFVPIIIAERHVGDQDNNMMGFDGVLYLYKYRTKLYGEVLFDDFSFAKDIFHNRGNKWGILMGGHMVDPFGLANTDLRFELTRIQPLVYSHKNPANTYSNYNNALGHWLGPDSDDLYVQIAHRPHKNLRFGVSFERRRKGENDINNQEAIAEDGRIYFLGKDVESNLVLGLIVEWQVRRDLFFNLNYNRTRTTNLGRMVGTDQRNHRLIVHISYDL